MNLQSGRKLRYHVTLRILQHRGGQWQRRRSSSELDLKDLFTGSLHEDGGEQFRVGFHLELVTGLFSLARERDPTSRRVHETSDEHPLRRTLARCVLRHFVVKFVRSHHVATLSVNPGGEWKTPRYTFSKIPSRWKIRKGRGIENSLLYRTIVVIGDNHGALPHAGEIEVLGVQMVLRGHPSYVNVSRILSREYSYPVEIFVHQFQAFRVEYLVPNRLDAAPRQNGHCFGRVSFWDLGRYHFQVRLWGKRKKFLFMLGELETKRLDNDTRLDGRTDKRTNK